MNSGAPSDYADIRRRRLTEYGTRVDKLGKLTQEQYAEPSHFLLELLQNAEDALQRRKPRAPAAERRVRFELAGDVLRVSHFGDPFNHDDVENICDIGESAKGPGTIGRFGLGFKSVYKFTDLPEVHSGPEDFVIENYVQPKCVKAVDRQEHETVFLIPKSPACVHWDALPGGLREMLTPDNLLFLRRIDSVEWVAPDGSHGQHERKSETISDGVRRVTIAGDQNGQKRSAKAQWLVFSRPIRTEQGGSARYIEIAFALDTSDPTRRFQVRRLDESPLYAYFPTGVSTNLGFLIQGPYNTTPARDNLRKLDRRNLDPWNARLVAETADLLREALSWFRDRGHLTVDLLNCLPFDEGQFNETTMFAPLFAKTKIALRDDRLLPSKSTGYVSAAGAKLARGKGLLDLFTPPELAALCGASGPMDWLSEEITDDREPALFSFLRNEERGLGIQELRPESVVDRLTCEFLTARPDDWIRRLYEFLRDQGGQRLLSSLRKKPVLRLADGTHVRPPGDGDSDVYLPDEAETGFLTVHPKVCKSEGAMEFLQRLGIRKPDLVDDVIENVLPKYEHRKFDLSTQMYEADLNRISRAWETDSRDARKRLRDRLMETRWVKTVDGAGTDAGWRSPVAVYLPTPQLTKLFTGIGQVWFADPSWMSAKMLDHDDSSLSACGARRYLRTTEIPTTPEDYRRVLVGPTRWRVHISKNCTIQGLEAVVDFLPRLSPSERLERSECLWNALCEAARAHGREEGFLHRTAHLSHAYHTQYQRLETRFVETLRGAKWVVRTDGVLQQPCDVVFSDLGWSDEPSLRQTLGFLSEEDRREGEEKDMIATLRGLGITDSDRLRMILQSHGATGGISQEVADAPDLSAVVEWWSGAKAEERRRYREGVYPSILDPSCLEDSNRVGWFTMFALSCFQSYGRTRDGQHRGFVDGGVRAGWWEDLANSRPPEEVNAWLERLNAWSDTDQPSQQFRMWRGSFVALYTVARHMDEYIRLMQKLPDIVEDMEGRFSLREVLDPTLSPAVRKLGVDAAPLAQTLGIGVNWMIRELLRAGLYERGGVMVPYAWMSSRRVRELLRQAGGPSLDEANPDHSRQIYEFVVEELGREVAEFDGDYDLPLQLWTMRGRK